MGRGNATETNKRIGKQIRKLRKESGLNQKEFGEMCGGYKQEDISNLECGFNTPSFELLILLSQKFDGVTTDWLIKENGVRGINPDLQFICDYTGLSPEAIEKLHLSQTAFNGIKGLDSKFFDYLIIKNSVRVGNNLWDIREIFDEIKSKKTEYGSSKDAYDDLMKDYYNEKTIGGFRYDIVHSINQSIDDVIAILLGLEHYTDITKTRVNKHREIEENHINDLFSKESQMEGEFDDIQVIVDESKEGANDE